MPLEIAEGKKEKWEEKEVDGAVPKCLSGEVREDFGSSSGDA